MESRFEREHCSRRRLRSNTKPDDCHQPGESAPAHEEGPIGSVTSGSSLCTGRWLWDQQARADALRIILVGKSGAGKSATGNSILGEQVFESRLSAQPVTRTCCGRWGSCAGKDVLVIDTPDFFSREVCAGPLDTQVRRCHVLSAPGPHVLLLVTQLGRFSAQDQRAVHRVTEVFGEDALGHTIILFTHKEDLEGASLTDYIRDSDNRALSGLVAACGGRFCAFDNSAAGSWREDGQVRELMGLVDRLLLGQGGAPLRWELSHRVTGPERPPVLRWEREGFKGSLTGYVDHQRPVTRAHASWLEWALVLALACVSVCLQLLGGFLVLMLHTLSRMSCWLCGLLSSTGHALHNLLPPMAKIPRMALRKTPGLPSARRESYSQ